MRVGRVLAGAMVAFVVSVVCLLPPGIHFVTGPIGPAIGGYVAGNRLRLSGGEAGITGAAMGLGLGLTLIIAFEFSAFMPDLALQASVPLSMIAALYAGLLGALGAWLSSKEPDPSNSVGRSGGDG